MAAIFGNIRYGKGTVGKLLMDTVFAENLDKTLVNAKQGSRGFKENMDAASKSFLLGGFFSKSPQEKREEKIKEQKKIKADKLKEKKKLRDEKLKNKEKNKK
jgi:phospholipid/cholesterol/gamma-HCH transport system substrate-binding protein